MLEEFGLSGRSGSVVRKTARTVSPMRLPRHKMRSQRCAREESTRDAAPQTAREAALRPSMPFGRRCRCANRSNSLNTTSIDSHRRPTRGASHEPDAIRRSESLGRIASRRYDSQASTTPQALNSHFEAHRAPRRPPHVNRSGLCSAKRGAFGFAPRPVRWPIIARAVPHDSSSALPSEAFDESLARRRARRLRARADPDDAGRHSDPRLDALGARVAVCERPAGSASAHEHGVWRRRPRTPTGC